MNSPKKRVSLPYNYDYKVTVSIGLMSDRSDTINPATHSEYTEEEWNALSEEDRKKWLDGETREWANDYIDFYWEE